MQATLKMGSTYDSQKLSVHRNRGVSQSRASSVRYWRRLQTLNLVQGMGCLGGATAYLHSLNYLQSLKMCTKESILPNRQGSSLLRNLSSLLKVSVLKVYA